MNYAIFKQHDMWGLIFLFQCKGAPRQVVAGAWVDTKATGFALTWGSFPLSCSWIFYWTRLKIRWIVLFCTGTWILSCRLDSSKTVSRCSLQCLGDWIIMLSGMWHTCCYYSRLTTIIHIPFFPASFTSWLRCRCVWVGQGFRGFLDLCEKVFFLIQCPGMSYPPQVEFFTSCSCTRTTWSC